MRMACGYFNTETIVLYYIIISASSPHATKTFLQFRSASIAKLNDKELGSIQAIGKENTGALEAVELDAHLNPSYL